MTWLGRRAQRLRVHVEVHEQDRPAQYVGIFAESYQTPNIASRRKLVRFIFEEMKGELLLCDEACPWELENGPGNHLLLIDRCLKNQVRKRNKEVEAESDRLLRHR